MACLSELLSLLLEPSDKFPSCCLNILFIMAKGKKALRDFINGIPDAKLTGFQESGGTIYTDQDFPLDMQEVGTLKGCELALLQGPFFEEQGQNNLGHSV